MSTSIMWDRRPRTIYLLYVEMNTYLLPGSLRACVSVCVRQSIEDGAVEQTPSPEMEPGSSA